MQQFVKRMKQLRPLVITHGTTSYVKELREHGLEVLDWPMIFPRGTRTWGFTLRRLWAATLTNFQAATQLRHRQVEVWICNDIIAFWHTAFGARLTGRPVVLTIRGTQAHFSLKWRLARTLASETLVLSREMVDLVDRDAPTIAPWFSRTWSSPQPHFIYSAVDITRLHPVGDEERKVLRAQLGIHDDTFAIGFVAAVRPLKRQLEFLKQAAPQLLQELPQAKIFFIGDFASGNDVYAARCREAVTKLRLKRNVIFTGYQQEMDPWYRALDLSCLATPREGLSRAMIEGLACGTPMVSFNVCSSREVLQEHACGLVVDQEDYPAMVRAIVKLARTPSLLANMRANGVTAARQLFDAETQVERLEQWLLTLCRK